MRYQRKVVTGVGVGAVLSLVTALFNWLPQISSAQKQPVEPLQSGFRAFVTNTPTINPSFSQEFSPSNTFTPSNNNTFRPSIIIKNEPQETSQLLRETSQPASSNAIVNNQVPNAGIVPALQPQSKVSSSLPKRQLVADAQPNANNQSIGDGSNSNVQIQGTDNQVNQNQGQTQTQTQGTQYQGQDQRIFQGDNPVYVEDGGSGNNPICGGTGTACASNDSTINMASPQPQR